MGVSIPGFMLKEANKAVILCGPHPALLRRIPRSYMASPIGYVIQVTRPYIYSNRSLVGAEAIHRATSSASCLIPLGRVSWAGVFQWFYDSKITSLAA